MTVQNRTCARSADDYQQLLSTLLTLPVQSDKATPTRTLERVQDGLAQRRGEGRLLSVGMHNNQQDLVLSHRRGRWYYRGSAIQSTHSCCQYRMPSSSRQPTGQARRHLGPNRRPQVPRSVRSTRMAVRENVGPLSTTPYAVVLCVFADELLLVPLVDSATLLRVWFDRSCGSSRFFAAVRFGSSVFIYNALRIALSYAPHGTACVLRARCWGSQRPLLSDLIGRETHHQPRNLSHRTMKVTVKREWRYCV